MARVAVAIIQSASTGSKEESLESVRRLASRIRGQPDLVLLPEYMMFDPTGMAREEVYRLAEDPEGPTWREFSRLAEKLGSCLLGHLFLRAPTGRVWNAAVLYGRDGHPLGVYRKTHLFDAYGYRESEFTEPGDRLWEPVEACGLKLGIAICYELRFPEVFRAQALAGAEAIAVPAAWYKGPGKEEALSVLARARAHENTTYILLASNAGPNFVGRSMIVHPMGYTLAQAPPWEWTLEAEIDTREVPEARRRLPVLKHVRPELYREATRSYPATTS